MMLMFFSHCLTSLAKNATCLDELMDYSATDDSSIICRMLSRERRI